MKSDVSSLQVRRTEVTEVTLVRRREYRVDVLNDLTARPIPAAIRTWSSHQPSARFSLCKRDRMSQ
ncbi:hypothetical protein [Caulobacter sp. UNC279MFTsu5.1]|uniref:hypothetical protein n=1 Tax=Caulobacter sp. UNC279MFTsu5.1 TaxID=1502775 RepID=UPI0011602F96|nr:hypothetical protein [Caulobacter sp. UNC279MFTsu5.1]